jgi:hypothetical protein
MSKLTIQINNLEALERLIGGDTEIEVDIRQNVVESFIRKHLKGIANETLVKQAVESVQKYVSNLLLDEVKGAHWWSDKSVLSGTAKNLLSDQAKDLVNNEVRTIVLEIIGTNNIVEQIRELIERQAEYIKGQLSDQVIKERLDRLVDQKIKEKLGIN